MYARPSRKYLHERTTGPCAARPQRCRGSGRSRLRFDTYETKPKALLANARVASVTCTRASQCVKSQRINGPILSSHGKHENKRQFIDGGCRSGIQEQPFGR
ncbi:hypothetical protein EVAR_4485_1 [Eumeta japonica]|uniref:Uncharacterized protein n=1 Tax=Eumeta variegata TaxID=151549 RepID=A0A4C1SYR9_EUMVA|nr:hypothetical protein EVAR_4485_1 [Eumeta japonica]